MQFAASNCNGLFDVGPVVHNEIYKSTTWTSYSGYLFTTAFKIDDRYIVVLQEICFQFF